MKTLLFAVNSKHKHFFEKIKLHTTCDVEIIHTSKLFHFSLKSLRDLSKMDFSPAIELRVKDFFARYHMPIPRFIIKHYYHLLAIIDYMRYFDLIDASYDQMVLWNGLSFRQAIAVEISKLYDIKLFYVENGLLPNTVVIDPKGVNAYNSVPRERAFYENYSTHDRPLPNQLVKRQPKKENKFKENEIDLPLKYIFIPFQIDHDTQILIHSPWIRHMSHLFEVIIKIANQLNNDLVFVFKEHPSNKKEYPKLHQEASKNEKIMFINNLPTQTLIQNAEAVITINSTVGIESLLFKQKVITLGNAFYSIDGITKHASSSEMLYGILSQLDDWEVNDTLITNFITYLYYDYLFQGTFNEPEQSAYPKIEKLLSCCNNR